MKKKFKHPEDMSAVELSRATKQFDQPFVFEKARPMTANERAHERKLRRGRPKIGKGARKISISIEDGLLHEADALAKKKGVNRSTLITNFLSAGLKRKAG